MNIFAAGNWINSDNCFYPFYFECNQQLCDCLHKSNPITLFELCHEISFCLPLVEPILMTSPKITELLIGDLHFLLVTSHNSCCSYKKSCFAPPSLSVPGFTLEVPTTKQQKMKRLCIVLFALFLFLSHNIAIQVSNPCDGASYCEVNVLIFIQFDLYPC